jgi:tetratricopeptide (TPR) repeat protein
MPAPIASVYGCYVLSRRISMEGSVELFQVRWVDNPSATLALKRLLPHLSADLAVRESFLDMARQAGLLNHPNLTQVLDQGQAAAADPTRDSQAPAPEASLFMVREWVQGKNLAEFLERANKRGRRLSPEMGIYIFHAAAKALEHALKEPGPDGMPMGLAHGHLNPQNLLIAHDGQVKVSDLGLAASLNGHKPQAAGDVRGLGSMLWEALSGRKLPRLGEAPPLSSLNPEAPPVLDAICGMALAWEPEEAFAHAGQLREALESEAGAQDRSRELAGEMAALFKDELARENEQQAGELRTAKSISNGRAKARTCGGILSKDEMAMLVTPEPPLPLWRRMLKSMAMALAAGIAVWAIYFFWPAGPAPEPPLPRQAKAAVEAIQAGEFAQAFVLLDQARAEHPELQTELTRLRAQAFLGRAAAKVEESPQEAQDDLLAAVELAPDWAQVHLQTGRVLTKLERWDEALAAYRQALRLDPELDAAWFNAGYILMQRNECEDAMADFAKVVALDSPHAADAHLNLAVCLVRLGDKEKALDELKLALVKNPNHKLARQYMTKLRGKKKSE